MFDRYNLAARRVIFFARQEVGRVGGRMLDPGHLLLGLLREAPTLVTGYLSTPKVAPALRRIIEQSLPAGEKLPDSVDVPLSPGCRQVLEAAEKESDRLGQREVTPILLLWGILSEPDSAAARALLTHDVDPAQVRRDAAGAGCG